MGMFKFPINYTENRNALLLINSELCRIFNVSLQMEISTLILSFLELESSKEAKSSVPFNKINCKMVSNVKGSSPTYDSVHQTKTICNDKKEQ